MTDQPTYPGLKRLILIAFLISVPAAPLLTVFALAMGQSALSALIVFGLVNLFPAAVVLVGIGLSFWLEDRESHGWAKRRNLPSAETFGRIISR